MGSKVGSIKLLEQKEHSLLGEMHSSIFRPATVVLLPQMQFHGIDIAKKSFSELQV